MDKQPIITIRHLNVTYFPGRENEVRALKDVSLEIFPGEFIVFFGPSGSGKSTLLYSIAGLERNIEGDLIVKDENLSGMKHRALEQYHQHTLGMIFQSYYLVSSLSIVENVALPQVAVNIPTRDRNKKALTLLEKFGVLAQAKKLPAELSGGQQQRVAVCRSLMNDPDILVADEPVGNLDSKSSEDVMNLLRHLNDDEKKTVILVTHDPSHLRHAHRIFYLRDGQITGTKTNTEEERNREPQPLSPTAAPPVNALEHWDRTHAAEDQKTTSTAVAEDHSNARKAEQILLETLTGLTMQEIDTLEDRIAAFLASGKQDHGSVLQFLERPVHLGGIGMEEGTAHLVAKDIHKLMAEVRRLRASSFTAPVERAHEIRMFTLHSLDIHLPGLTAARQMDEIIRQRLAGEIDRVAVQKALNKPVDKGGTGMSAFTARSASRTIESLMDTPSPAPTPHP